MLYCTHMPAKKSAGKPITLDSLAALVSRTAATADKKFAALADDISGVKERYRGREHRFKDPSENFARIGEGSEIDRTVSMLNCRVLARGRKSTE
jgi:hypothetical protein